ncbi:haloalkane dehalogenase [Aeromicrobium sp.]|uniref:haloalkane dehalogenase n=1 Tax=Aeromicrobium sp. TaxID=1871063 RepID=UPI003C458D21
MQRTPDERFVDLPDFPHEPHYREWEGMRLAHVDVGEGSTVVLLHGEPTWSFMWRKAIAPLVEAGHRCIAPDLPGFGRSDKPADDWYTYDRLVAAVVSLFEDLDLTDVTLVVHDWGGPVGLRVATTEVPERISRIVIMDSGLFTGHQKMGKNWQMFRDFIDAEPDMPIGMLVNGGSATELSPEVIAAYEAPFPTVDHKGGARRLPALIPQSPEDPGAAEGRAAVEALAQETRPLLLLWADADTILPLEPTGRAMESSFPVSEPLHVIEGAGHFLAEDQGKVIGATIADWLARQA